MRDADGAGPRVLIVEDDPELAMATVWACLEVGLEPKLCLGAERSTDCPGLAGQTCPRSSGIEATFVAISTGKQRIATPACAAGPLVVAGERPLVGHATLGALAPSASIDYPYDPDEVAALLAEALVAPATPEPSTL